MGSIGQDPFWGIINDLYETIQLPDPAASAQGLQQIGQALGQDNVGYFVDSLVSASADQRDLLKNFLLGQAPVSPQEADESIKVMPRLQTELRDEMMRVQLGGPRLQHDTELAAAASGVVPGAAASPEAQALAEAARTQVQEMNLPEYPRDLLNQMEEAYGRANDAAQAAGDFEKGELAAAKSRLHELITARYQDHRALVSDSAKLQELEPQHQDLMEESRRLLTDAACLKTPDALSSAQQARERLEIFEQPLGDYQMYKGRVTSWMRELGQIDGEWLPQARRDVQSALNQWQEMKGDATRSQGEFDNLAKQYHEALERFQRAQIEKP